MVSDHSEAPAGRSNNSALGILGGTFDPVHFGHLRTALEVGETLKLAEVRLLPCFQPPHRGEPAATPDQRVAMLDLAVDGVDGLCVDNREVDRGGVSYMVDTLKSFRDEMPDRSLCLILGADALTGFHRWHRWEEIFSLAHLAILERPGAPGDLDHALEVALEKRWAHWQQGFSDVAGGVYRIPVTQLDISATRIRALVRQGRDPSYLLPQGVCEYIRQHQLFVS